MPRSAQKITAEQEEAIQDFTERVLDNGEIELEFDYVILGLNIHFSLLNQTQTEEVYEEAGRDFRGNERDGYTRELMFRRLSLIKSIKNIDGMEISELMNRRLLGLMQEQIVQAIYTKYAAEREAIRALVFKAVGLIKK